MNNEQAKQLLSSVDEEDLFEHGVLFTRMDPEGKVFWKVLEAIDTDEGRRVTFHLYYRDIFLKSLVGILTTSGRVQWGVK